jgi:hypothetical protein
MRFRHVLGIQKDFQSEIQIADVSIALNDSAAVPLQAGLKLRMSQVSIPKFRVIQDLLPPSPRLRHNPARSLFAV